ncbi:MAG: ABC transporter ATP-binding protein [Parasporobacterium sp.]|nr:ABC transporter ATP-binding protein [Parasporobacterium sp.]MBQ9033015.1 ABC transporter ATP-binding protein [Parasporobacterium sp.]
MSEVLLRVQELTQQFKGVLAVDHINMDLETGKIYGLIGTNGAGKSTVINMISGNLFPTEGQILYEDKPITHVPAAQRARAGIARTFQNLRLFEDQTVLDNVITASQITRTYTLFEMLTYMPRYRREEKEFAARSLQALQTMGIEQYASYQADSLAYAFQRRLEIARCLAIRPKLLLLDEPAAGMNPQESLQLVEDIRKIHQVHPEMTILLIEHDMKVVMNLCEYIYVMASGRMIAEGTPRQIYESEEVISVYLGGSAHRIGKQTAGE